MSLLDGKVCLVTGASRGIGTETVRRFAEEGAIVYGAGRTEESVDKNFQELSRRFHTSVISLCFDVTDEAAAKRAVMRIKKEQGRLDVLVNNAGIMKDRVVGMISQDLMQSVFDVNVFAVISIIQLAAKLMVQQGSGSVVNLSSIAGLNGAVGQMVYSASKGAVNALTKSASKELSPREIRVNAVPLGLIDADLLRSVGEKKVEENLSRVRMGRLREPDDVADVITFLASNLSRYVTGEVFGYVGFLNSGIVPLQLSSHPKEGLLQDLLGTYQPSYLWVPEGRVERFPSMEAVYFAYGYSLLRTGYEKDYPLYGELALMIPTSGSTGSPKLVRQFYINILDNAELIAEYMKLDETERSITTFPMNDIYGLSIINSYLLTGGNLLLTDKTLMQKELWRFFKEARAISFDGIPCTYEMLDKLWFYRMEFSTFRTMTQAGGKIACEPREKFVECAREKGKQFVVVFGASEVTSRMGYLPPERAVEKKGSMGIPIPGGKFWLIDADGNESTGPYTMGELVYGGRNVTLGYAGCREDQCHGVLATGDIAQFDEDSYYYIVGRKKRFLKIYENRVNLDELDWLIRDRFGIEVASAGVDDHVHIYMTDKKAADTVREFVAGKTKLNLSAFAGHVIGEIPMNDSGKIRYQELARYYEK